MDDVTAKPGGGSAPVRWAARSEKVGVAADRAWRLGAAVVGGRRRVALGGRGA